MAQKLAGLTVAMLAALQAAQASPLRKVPQPHVFGVKEALKKKGLIDHNHVLTPAGYTALKTVEATNHVTWPYRYTITIKPKPPEA